ncbi:EamA family transporter [Nakamurella sp.]|uniref:EamA family transporter n=1 Tax=Nakamurella sp. TaxID=1869182 RepID=UPI0037847F26
MGAPHRPRFGLLLALLTAAAFGTSGAFARSLIDAGWSPSSAVTARVTIAAVVLLVPSLIALRGRWRVLRRNLPMITAFGLVAIAGCQVAYFNAVQHLSVGVALLLEYMGIVLVVGWLWARHRQRPRGLTIGGTVVSVLGLVLVLDLAGDATVDLVGVFWGLVAAVGLAVFFVLSAKSDPELPPLVMAGGGMTIGAAVLLALSAIGVLPVAANTNDVVFAGHGVPWWVPVAGLSLIAAVFAYVVGIMAARSLGSKLASFVGLTEVLFAVLFAWLLLGQLPTVVQLIGGVLIVAGVALVRIDELRSEVLDDPVVPAPAG